ncbi:MAG: DUF3597 domain-containing protein [Pseudomonadota bacterium]|jgi:hypothetical protein|nr:DUF3597 domain-containing protein [Pseudomonadota bacterium]
MSIFSAIKNAIFGHPAAAQTSDQQAQANATLANSTPVDSGQAAAVQQPVDVEAVLKEISSEKGNPDLNWQSSIVDLMKLLGMDSSLSNREQLATELGYTGDKNGSAEMNIWLHKATMQKLAENGGRVPATMLA